MVLFTFPRLFCSSALVETSRPSGWTLGFMLVSGLHKLLHCGQQIRSFCLKSLHYFVFLGSGPTSPITVPLVLTTDAFIPSRPIQPFLVMFPQHASSPSRPAPWPLCALLNDTVSQKRLRWWQVRTPGVRFQHKNRREKNCPAAWSSEG